jgi:hypothetical protein
MSFIFVRELYCLEKTSRSLYRFRHCPEILLGCSFFQIFSFSRGNHIVVQNLAHKTSCTWRHFPIRSNLFTSRQMPLNFVYFRIRFQSGILFSDRDRCFCIRAADITMPCIDSESLFGLLARQTTYY